MFSLSEHKIFEGFILSCIVLNAIVLAVTHVGMSKEMEDVLQYMNWFFTGIFFIEMIIRLLAIQFCLQNSNLSTKMAIYWVYYVFQ